MSKYIGLWYGGHGYSHGDIDRYGERFDSLAEAKATLLERYNSNGHRKCTFLYLDREPDHLFCPGVGENCEITLYRAGDDQRFDYPDYVVRLGPKGGAIIERC